ncbi:hypothetical protein BH09BAC5_BH09BAC5_06240 [soil metagenome]
MEIKLIANIENHGDAGYIAWIDSIKGLVVQGNSMDEACRELMTSLKVKLAYDLGLSASELKEITPEEAAQMKREFVFKEYSQEPCKREINLTLR